MTPLLLSFILLFSLPTPNYESPASTFARLEAQDVIPPWSEPTPIPANLDRRYE